MLYVWIDALSNYITALGYGSATTTRASSKYWPADVHLIGKEILWFHTVYWPAMLLSLGLPLPKQVFAHGWWTAEGQKMSKIAGELHRPGAAPRRSCARYGEDALRYYLLRAAPFGSDLDWNDAEFDKTLQRAGQRRGQLLNRTLNMVGKYRDGTLPAGERDRRTSTAT